MAHLLPTLNLASAGPSWLEGQRAAAREALGSLAPPSSTEEVWRYAPIDRLDLSELGDVGAAATATPPALAGLLEGAHVLSTANGLLEAGASGDGWTAVASPDEAGVVGSIVGVGDAHTALSLAFAPSPVRIVVERRAVVERPIVLVHHLAAGALALPRLAVELGEDAQATVVEVFVGSGGATMPVTELDLAAAARLSHASVQLLGEDATALGRIGGRVARDANLALSSASFGGSYARLRSDVELAGEGASSQVRSTYLGTGSQVHDLRTMQDHRAPRTTSDMLCKGAVTGTSRSVYTGLIRMVQGARRAEANQTNHNLVLDEHAHADSVPNLDIAENDVRCSHGSTVGPIDPDQRYYLESKGIDPDAAERLIVAGFFADAIAAVPVEALRSLLVAEASRRLDAVRAAA